MATKVVTTAAPPSHLMQSLHLQRGPVLGFCIEDGQFTDAVISGDVDGTFVIEGQIARAPESGDAGLGCGDAGTDLSYSGHVLCDEHYGPRTLSAAEVSGLDSKLAAFPDKVCAQWVNANCDPCVSETVTVDGTAFDADCCGDLNAEYATAFGSLLDYIDSLRVDAM